VHDRDRESRRVPPNVRLNIKKQTSTIKSLRPVRGN